MEHSIVMVSKNCSILTSEPKRSFIKQFKCNYYTKEKADMGSTSQVITHLLIVILCELNLTIGFQRSRLSDGD
jgi:hypothetical protein